MEVLEKLYKDKQPIKLDVNGVQISFGPSFLSEAFGLFAKDIGLEKFNKFFEVIEDTEKSKRFKEKMMEYVMREIENI